MSFITVSAKSPAKIIKMYLESFWTWWLRDAVCGAGGMIPLRKIPLVLLLCQHRGARPTAEAAEWRRSHQNPDGREQGRKGKSEIS